MVVTVQLVDLRRLDQADGLRLMSVATWRVVDAFNDEARPCHVAIPDGTFLDTWEGVFCMARLPM